MPMMTLSPAELWFCAPDVPAQDEALVCELKGKKRTILMRAVRSRLPSLQEGRWAYELFVRRTDRRGPSAVLRREGTLYWSDDQDADEMHWRLASGEKSVGRTERVWRPTSDDRFVVSLRHTGEGTVLEACQDHFHFATVQFNWGQEVSSSEFDWWLQSEFEAFCAQQFELEDSPLRRAYEWHGWSEEERTAFVTRCQWGTWAEMKSLAECVLQLSFQPQQDEPFWGVDVWDVLDEDNNDPFRFHLPSDGEEQWAQTLRRVFRPCILRHDVPRYERDHLNQLFLEIHPHHLRVEPSAHEKLEAMLRLREWAQRHAPDEAAQLLDFPR